MSAALINLYHQAEDYFFKGISSKCLNLADEYTAYMTGGAEYQKKYKRSRKNFN